MDLLTLALTCAPSVAPATMEAIVKVESGGNPYAIGVVAGRLERQPRTLDEALATVEMLEIGGWNYSVGLAQINQANLPKYSISIEQAFDPCTNLKVGSAILLDCFTRASRTLQQPQEALRASLSCYYSGNFTRGLAADVKGTSYVDRVLSATDSAAVF